MSKTLLTIIIVAGVVIVFVLARFTGVDTEEKSLQGNETGEVHPTHEFDAWVTFEPQDHSFTASFPRQPAHISEDAHDAFGLKPKKYDIYAADGLDKKGYMVEVISFPEGPDPETDEQILQNTLQDILSHSTLNQLEKSKEKIFKGRDALTFNIDSGERKLVGVIFVRNKTLFILTRISPEDYSGENEDYEFFIESIQFPEENNHKDPS